MRILIIEDDEAEASNLGRILGKLLECEAIVAGTLEVAWDILGSFDTDAILLDLSLPGSSVDQTAESLSLMTEKHPPVVVLTGMTGLRADELRIRCIDNGAYNFVQKDHISEAGSVGWQLLAGIVRDACLSERFRKKKSRKLHNATA